MAAYTYYSYTGDGVTNNPHTFGFNYRSTDDIVVKIDGSLQVEGSGNNYTFPNATQVQMNAAVPDGSLLTIERNTSQDTKLVVFTAGTLTSIDLNAMVEQLFFMAQEALSGIVAGATINNAANITYNPAGASAIATNVQDKLREYVSAKDFGAAGDGAADDTAELTAWLTYLATTGQTGLLPYGTYLCNQIDLATVNGLRIVGDGTIKATGSTRQRLIRFTNMRGLLSIDGITIDGANIAARGLEIRNESSTSSTLGTVYFGPDFTVKNIKNTAPDTNQAYGCLVVGGFKSVTSECEIDSVEDTRTSSAGAFGLVVTWSATAADDYPRSTVIGGKSRIRNVQNGNTVLQDADGVQCFAPTGVNSATLTVSPGARFEECEGRAIKSQVQGNTIIGASISRTAYDGLIEIDLQYSGGVISGNKIYHDNVRVDQCINITLAGTPDNRRCEITNNELLQLTAPAVNTTSMVALTVDNASRNLDAVNVSGNKLTGKATYFTNIRIANVTKNFVRLRDNWAEEVATAFINCWRYGTGTPILWLLSEGNSCDTTAPAAVNLTNTQINPLLWESNRGIPSYKNEMKAYVGSALTNKTGDGTAYDIVFDTEDYDPLAAFSSATFTAPVTGRYRFTTNLKISGITAAHTELTAQVRAATSGWFAYLDPSSMFATGGVVCINGEIEHSLTDGDTVTVRLAVSGSTKTVGIDAAGEHSYFRAEFIGE